LRGLPACFGAVPLWNGVQSLGAAMPAPISSVPIALGPSIRHAFDFTQSVWRRAWGVQLLAAVGPTLMFVAQVAVIDGQMAADLWSVGLAMTLVTVAPLMGAILRLRLGGTPETELGPGGLQLGAGELRLLAALAGGVAASLLAWLPLVAVTALVVVVFRDLGLVDLGGAEPVPFSLFIVAAAVVATAAVYAYGLSRLALTLPAAIDRPRFAVSEAWRAGAGAERALAGGLLLSLSPTAIVFATALWLDRFNGALGWAWEDAAAAGALFAGIMTFVQAPLTLGLLGGVYLLRTEPSMRKPFHLRRLEKQFAALEA
jgi:hypothetical protein